MTDQVAEIYVDIKEAAQILNNVSIRTAYRYIAKGAVGLSIATTTDVASGFAVKLYRKEDIVALSRALNKDRTILSYVPVNVRPAANGIGDHTVMTEALASAVEAPAVNRFDRQITYLTPVVKFSIFSTLIIGVLILIGGVFLWRYIKKERLYMVAGIEALRQDYRDSRLIQQIQDEQKIFFDLES